MTRPPVHCIGIDPGVNTGIVVIDDLTGSAPGACEKPKLIHASTIRFSEHDLIDYATLARAALPLLCEGYVEPFVVIEDQLTGGAFVRSGGRRQHPVSIAIPNAIAGILAVTMLQFTPHVRALAPVKWYPRVRGRLLKKAQALALIKQQVERRDVLPGCEPPHNEHEWMALGLALVARKYAQVNRALEGRDRLVRTMQGGIIPDAQEVS